MQSQAQDDQDRESGQAFADDGRVERFEEWAFWPGRPHTGARDVS